MILEERRSSREDRTSTPYSFEGRLFAEQAFTDLVSVGVHLRAIEIEVRHRLAVDRRPEELWGDGFAIIGVLAEEIEEIPVFST